MIKQTLMIAGAALLFTGCASDKEGLILQDMTKKTLPKVKQEAKAKKTLMLSGQKCLHKAKSVDAANACNAMMRQKDPEVEVEDFSNWTEKELAEVDRIANEQVAYFDCILAAKTMSAALDCKEP
jgi:biotin synthase-related radical SAM superfamily protein